MSCIQDIFAERFPPCNKLGMNEIPNLYEALSHVLREARKERKITQRELAERMGCARSFVAAIEGCKFQPTINTFLCLANALGMEPEELIRLLKTALLVLNNRYGGSPPKKKVRLPENRHFDSPFESEVLVS